MKNDPRPYGLAPAFERAVVTLLCSRPSFYGRAGSHIVAKRFTEPAAQLAADAAGAVALDGGAPSNLLTVVQRIRTWCQDGRANFELLNKVNDLFDAAEDAGLPDEDEVVRELLPALRKQASDDLVVKTMDAVKRGNYDNVIDLASRIKRMGHIDNDAGMELSASAGAVAAHAARDVLTSGIFELDLSVEGGLARGELGVVVGPTGSGKSIYLSQQAGHAAKLKLTVAAATLELSAALWSARAVASLTGVPTNSIVSDPSARAQAYGQLNALGVCFMVKEFPALATTVDDLSEWIDRCAQRLGRGVDLLVVDYGDKVGAQANAKLLNSYESGRVVFEGLRTLAVEQSMYCWTASQSTRRKGGTKGQVVGLDDVADSMHKARCADLLLTLNPEEGGKSTKIHVAKNRNGPAGAVIGPLPTDFEVGRVAPSQ